MHYFVQAAPGAEWKAVALSWVYDAPRRPGVFDDTAYARYGFDVRDREVAGFARGAGGEAVLSPAAGADREVCGRYAKYLTFTAPDGEAESADFVPGELTTEVVGAYNAGDAEMREVTWRQELEVAGGLELPVVRLADGKSLVTCTFTRTDRLTAPRSMAFRYGSGLRYREAEALLGGEGKSWRRTTVRWSVTASVEVPERGPADVVGCSCLRPFPLSADGVAK
ncbi:hypothetical protein ABZZ17_05805 [Streptomyces sp. NPDC006512]|uniref:hypothetical protein n=1 Tax=Streptomyces sp. NPDC006512 TaxID=3154307 RepID=UPI0033BBB5EB